jgi:hypothetical protein
MNPCLGCRLTHPYMGWAASRRRIRRATLHKGKKQKRRVERERERERETASPLQFRRARPWLPTRCGSRLPRLSVLRALCIEFWPWEAGLVCNKDLVDHDRQSQPSIGRGPNHDGFTLSRQAHALGGLPIGRAKPSLSCPASPDRSALPDQRAPLAAFGGGLSWRRLAPRRGGGRGGAKVTVSQSVEARRVRMTVGGWMDGWMGGGLAGSWW